MKSNSPVQLCCDHLSLCEGQNENIARKNLADLGERKPIGGMRASAFPLLLETKEGRLPLYDHNSISNLRNVSGWQKSFPHFQKWFLDSMKDLLVAVTISEELSPSPWQRMIKSRASHHTSHAGFALIQRSSRLLLLHLNHDNDAGFRIEKLMYELEWRASFL